MITGVYCITNTVNGKRYVGSASKSLNKRLWTHKNLLRKGKHSNEHLQNAWNKYGESSFEFETLEECCPENCLSREQYYLDKLRTFDRKIGYNKSPTAGSPLGVIHSVESRRTVSRSLIGKKKSKSHSMKIRRAKVLMSGYTKSKMSLYARNRKKSHIDSLLKNPRSKRFVKGRT